MYEVLVAHLRECEELDPSNNTYKEAADTIEELSKRSECPCWYGGMRFCSILGRSIPEPSKEEN